MVCIGHAYISIAYVFFMTMVCVLVVYAWCWSWLDLYHHVKVDVVFVGCVCHEGTSVMHWLCMLVLICRYAYTDLVIVVVHELIICGWYGHAW